MGMLWLLAAYGLSLIAYLVLNGAAGRLLGVRYATFSSIVAAAAVLGQLALFGAHRAGLREVARLDPADRATRRALGRDASAVAFVAVPAVSAASALGCLLLLRDEPGAGAVALLTGLLVAMTAWQKLAANYLRGLGRLGVASILDGGSGGATTLAAQALLLCVLLEFETRTSLSGVLWCCALAYLPALALGGGLMWRAELLVWSRRSHLRLLRVLRRYRVFALIQVVGFASVSIEIWIASLALPQGSAAGFDAAARLALLYGVPLNALQSVASPAISRLAGGSGSTAAGAGVTCQRILGPRLLGSARHPGLRRASNDAPDHVWTRLLGGRDSPGGVGARPAGQRRDGHVRACSHDGWCRAGRGLGHDRRVGGAMRAGSAGRAAVRGIGTGDRVGRRLEPGLARARAAGEGAPLVEHLALRPPGAERASFHPRLTSTAVGIPTGEGLWSCG